MKKPDKPGLYWARSWRCEWWNLVVQVTGEAPYLKINNVWSLSDDRWVRDDVIGMFGPGIYEPEPPVLSQDEKRY